MTDLISRQAVNDALERTCDLVCQYSKEQRYVMCGACPLASAFDAIMEVPTIDPVKHELSGEWVPIEMRYGFGCGVFDCTLCHNTAEIPVENGSPVYKFCPHCGARMNE